MSLKSFSKSISLFIAGILLFGCGPTRLSPVNLVLVVDLTSSVEVDAQAEAFDALSATLRTLQRGDTVTIIPITGDAATQGQGRILRFELSQTREAYNADIRRFTDEAKKKLQELRQAAAEKPYTNSDILGAVALASEELRHEVTQPATKNIIVFLSDFIQDDPQFNFNRDARLTNEKSGAEFGEKLARLRPRAFESAIVYIGLLRSKDLRNLPQTRRSSINAFWVEYFNQSGAEVVESAIDGSGRLTRFLKDNRQVVREVVRDETALAKQQR